MFDSLTDASILTGGIPLSGAEAAQVAGWSDALAGELHAADDAARLQLIRELERLKCAAAAAQAVLAVRFDDSQRAEQAERGVPADRRGRGVAAQIALARRESPQRGQRDLGLARILHGEMPHTLHAFRQGAITEWSATILARETACLDLPGRLLVDETLAADADKVAELGPWELEAQARKLAYRLDPQSYVARRASAEADRRVTLRPAPDLMSHLSALLPAAQGVAMFAALTREADSLRAGGDARSRGQIMADTLVERVTGQTTATAVPVTVNVVISDAALLAGHDQPGFIDGYGPVPAELIRDLATHPEAVADLRRLYARPDTGELVAMDSRSRCFRGLLALMVRLRDQFCRTPWCDAPIRHTDHPEGVDEGGDTSYVNSQGLCEACNHAKQAPGWRARPGPGGTVETTTPAGVTFRTGPPGVPLPADLWHHLAVRRRDLALAT
jgi:hypothetical protein